MARGGRWRPSTLMTNGTNITSTGNNPNTLYYNDFRSGFDVFAAHNSTGTLTSPSGQYPVTNQSVSLYRTANAHTDPNFGLILEAQKDPVTGQWYSALVDARYTLQYSPPVLIEVRCKMTNAQGMWPSAWMLPTPLTTTSQTGFYGPWPSSGEADLFEAGEKTHKGAFNGTIHGDNPLGSGFANHWQLPDPNTTNVWKTADVTQYHIYGLEWRTTGFKWFLDGVQWQATTAGPNAPAPYDRPFYPIFNIAVGGTYPGAPDTTTPTSGNFMIVDWFRVTQLSPNPIIVGTTRPWVSTSAWNAPITTSTATYTALPQTAASMVDPALGHTDMYLEQNQTQLYYASNTDPTVTVTVTVNNAGGPAGTYPVKIPANTIPGGPDSAMSVDGVDGKCYDFYGVVQTSPTAWTTGSMYAYSLTTDTGFGIGTYPNGTRRGARADGSQQNGGNFTVDDWNRGLIDHGLAIELPNSVLKSGPVFPAVNQNGDGTTAYTGTIPIGTKLAIKPPSAGGPAKPTTLSAIGSMVWDALVTYGGHVVSRGNGFALIATGGAKPVQSSWIAPLRSTAGVFPSSDGDIILSHLSVCTNWGGTAPPPPPPPPPAGAVAVWTGGPWYTGINWSTAVLHGHPRTFLQWVATGNLVHAYINVSGTDAVGNTWHTYNTDPFWTITGMFNGDVNVGGTATIRIPANVFEKPNGGDYNLNVWNHDTRIHYDFYGFHITSSAARTGTAQAIWQRSDTFDGWGTGVYPNGTKHGVRAAGNQYAGGEISAADLRAGVINHALGAAAARSNWLANACALPAMLIDGGGGYTGNVLLGSLFAIPPVSLGGPAKPSGLSTIGSMVWDACSTYGTYVVDSTGSWTWYSGDGNDPAVGVTSISMDPLRFAPNYDGDKILNAMQLITSAKPTLPNQA